MKPAAYRTKSGLLFKNAPDAPLELTPLYEMPKPLSDEEIKELIVNKVTDYELCRAIEERHGIK